MSYFKGSKEYFPNIGKIGYEGPDSKNPLAFKYYNENEVIDGKTMKDHLRFAIAYWHCFCADGSDPFGSKTIALPWNSSNDGMTNAMNKADAAFEFFTKIGAPFYCWHDRDLVPEGNTLAESENNLIKMTDVLLERQKETGMKLLWGTANVFTNPRYMNGASTNPQFDIVAHAAFQVKSCIDATIKLGGQGYTFWGGREGYMSLLNTQMKREKEHLATFLSMARDYGRKQGFTGCFYIEPKPMEPTKHQYDYDSETVLGFLKEYGLEKDFKLNIEANHAELSGHDFKHELLVCAEAGMLGSVDANRGDPVNGWDTDQFPNDLSQTTAAMEVILNMGGFKTGGLNFDAKIRRNSTDMDDLFLAHIGGMDTFALGLKKAVALKEDGRINSMVEQRYSSFDSGNGKKFENKELILEDLAKLAPEYDQVKVESGKQELFENIFNTVLWKAE